MISSQTVQSLTTIFLPDRCRSILLNHPEQLSDQSFSSVSSKTETCPPFLPSQSPSRTTTPTPLRVATRNRRNTLRRIFWVRFGQPSTRDWPWCRPGTLCRSCSTPGRCRYGPPVRPGMCPLQLWACWWACKMHFRAKIVVQLVYFNAVWFICTESWY